MDREAEATPEIADDAERRALWTRAGPIEGMDPDMYRHDDYGNIIKYTSFNDRQSDYGWEADYSSGPGPTAVGGDEPVARPLHWRAKTVTTPRSSNSLSASAARTARHASRSGDRLEGRRKVGRL
ncbi:hypothetical protein [Roseospira visakhapatnamensis]|uniref:Uncharacterized protein n=1 Tax=Roseospira visakhapatnamensis TaxID=390880 RepID=A0A7W6RDH8_9PROT|nr:hypothetical protein [Roseospira visakhapatnamensis]MBB4266322.1 hypothetical protein [Roseospira visakhapatnamensis]